MNILTEQLPTAVEIDDVVYDLDTDFRTCLNIILAFEDPELTSYEKQMVMLELLYKEIPENINEACRLGVKFLDCGEDPETEETHSDGAGRLYSFNQDAKYIYSAIKQSHGVDLEIVDYLHWWKFCYMFLDLREDCFFHRLIHLRRQKNLGKLTKEEKELYYRIQDIVDVPEVRTTEEQIVASEFMRLLKQGKNEAE
ncbi:bacteriophage Gp15 family protein [Dehalobacter sp.]|uniref:bacteriophage Gp15 family protein n=1 Tax=Dehalobacter sp. TaxID=1962289 RepID=UPI00258CD45D|nr:bacteriophage Gp15 family protein [Dehalobacter sp.]MDJ0305393.1 bacteriophage Gp15 family protein [Dehalobacter sp.]